MHKLRLGFTDTFDSIKSFFTDTLSREFDIEIDNENPDYLIFGDANFGQNNLNYNNKNCIKIFYTGENQRPEHYQAHYAISFDHRDDERHYRLPLYVVYDYENQKHGVTSHLNNIRTLDGIQDKGFCSFVVKNPGCEKRNRFFHILNSYKPVVSAGPLFNNHPIVPYEGSTFRPKMDLLRNYKFNLCFENSSYPGYATEKLYEALVSNTVPIYWGSPTIECDFNPKAFLSWHTYQDDESFVRAIVEIDNNWEEYSKMYLEPMHLYTNKYYNLDRFVYWFKKNVYKGVIN